VRRILVREGETISKDAPVVEIAIRPAVSATPTTNTQSAEQRASLAVQSAAVAVESARAEVVRTEAEVGRLTSLVSSGAATQAELDGARAEYERAQRQLQRAQDERRQAESALLAARQPGSPPSEDQAGEQIITVRAPSAGAVRTVTARAGERVNDGQALVTLTVTPQ
jgi:HlyD family secretion protein